MAMRSKHAHVLVDYYKDNRRGCLCRPLGRIEKYRQRISRPLLDSIDLHVKVPRSEIRIPETVDIKVDSEAV